jgi:S-adenosylmethionine synthetase
VDEVKLAHVVQEIVNLSPRGIREMLRMNRPIYAETSAYGHFGRTPDLAKDTFTWERTDTLAPELKRAFGR